MNDSRYIQRETANLNKQLSNSFLRTGFVIIGIVLLLFGFMSVFGYNKVEKVGTLDNCEIKTKVTEHRGRNGKAANLKNTYQVAVVYQPYKTEISSELYGKFGIDPSKPDRIVDDKVRFVMFDKVVGRNYYKKFLNCKKDRITFFKAEDGEIFPVYNNDSTEREAEKAYRDYAPPYLWYSIYGIGLGLGILSVILGAASRSTAKNYADNTVTSPSVNYDNFNSWNK